MRVVGKAIASRSAAAAGEPAAVRGWRSASPNRGPPKNRDEALTSSIRILAAGIDSLYVSFKGETDPARLDGIEFQKARAQETGQPQLFLLGADRKALVQPSGWGSYRYWLRCGGFDVFVGRGRGMPAVYARIASEFIHEVGPLKALADLKSCVGALLDQVDETICSRVDIYADFQGWVPVSEDYNRFVTRSRRNTSHIAVHHDGRRFTGFTFGRDAMVARLYDKSLEIAHSGKRWMHEVWGDGLDVSAPVWRLEFQLRREILAECSLTSPQDVLDLRPSLWTYAMQWLSLREPTPGATRTRWPVASVWSDLERSQAGVTYSPLVRKRIREHDESVLVRGLAGYASSLAAVTGVSDLDLAMLVSRRRVGEYMDSTGRDFRDLVLAKRARKL
ncbi:MAG TPA: hypothetical protein VFB69_07655 [Candidatus Dormibacteraeota bacterium]|nr:hypothetical protein [Candidatus Dormibacteraeota bacterium]